MNSDAVPVTNAGSRHPHHTLPSRALGVACPENHIYTLAQSRNAMLAPFSCSQSVHRIIQTKSPRKLPEKLSKLARNVSQFSKVLTEWQAGKPAPQDAVSERYLMSRRDN